MLKELESDSIDSVVTDPPYGLSQVSSKAFNECMLKWCTDDRSFIPKVKGFMGKSWDAFVPPPSLWDEVFRVLKPGGHALVFAGSRTQDLMGLSLRLSGFEIRDCIQWIYGSGFPKSLNISKAIDKAKGEERELVGYRKSGGGCSGSTITPDGLGSHFIRYGNQVPITAPSSQEAKEWEGWGTALKPSFEPAILVRKPFRGSVAQNVLDHGVGGINVDGCRIETLEDLARQNPIRERTKSHTFSIPQRPSLGHEGGRWPSNVIISEEVSEDLTKKHGVKTSGSHKIKGGTRKQSIVNFTSKERVHSKEYFSNSGSVSRYFYCAKASREEREMGLDGFEKGNISDGREAASDRPYLRKETKRANIHPTVKPIALMKYLCRLITPPGGTVLEPFMGSGSTGIGAIKEGFDFIGIEREEEYFEIAKARIEYWTSIDLTYEDNEEKVVGEQLSLFGN